MRLDCGSQTQSTVAAETGNRDAVTQDRSVEDPPVWWLGPLRTAWEADKVLENLHRQRHCQLKLNRARITEGRLLGFWEATGWASGAVGLPTCIIRQEKGRMILKTKRTSAGASLSHGLGRALSLLSSWEWAPLLWLHPGPRGWGRRPAGLGDRARSQRVILEP